jgi:hypothetical protein
MTANHRVEIMNLIKTCEISSFETIEIDFVFFIYFEFELESVESIVLQ